MPRYKAKRSGHAAPQDLNTYEPGTCNTIDDVTGFKVKLSETNKRWDGLQVTDENFEPRQPQDFPVKPRPPKVYKDSRSEDENNILVYTPVEDVTKL
jgi:hypothetical protein